MPDSNEQLIQESLQVVPGGHHGTGLHVPYPAFASGDGSSWTAVMDPSVMTGFGFPGSNMMPGQYIVGSEMIWSQDPLLMGYQFLNPVAIEQTPNMLSDQSIPNSIDSVSQITPAFCSMAVNGSVQGIVPVGQSTVIPSAPDIPSGVENIISTSTTSSSQGESSAPQGCNSKSTCQATSTSTSKTSATA